MSKRVLIAATALAAAAFALRPGTALANKPLYNLSGTVTEVPVGQHITVDGHSYPIAPGSAAVGQVEQVVQGETVQVTLNGPAGARTTQAVAIHATSGH